MKTRYKSLDVFNKKELDSIKVGDKIIINKQNKYPLTVMAVTNDFLVGYKETKDGSVYSLLTKTIDGYSRNAATAEYPHVGPDSYYGLCYENEELAQEHLDKFQAWYNAISFGITSPEYKEYEKAELKKYIAAEEDFRFKTNITAPTKHYRIIQEDPRSRHTTDLTDIKVLFNKVDEVGGIENAA